MLNVTPSAVNHIKEMISSRGKNTLGIKVGINTKGCSGLSYTMEFVDQIKKGDPNSGSVPNPDIIISLKSK